MNKLFLSLILITSCVCAGEYSDGYWYNNGKNWEYISKDKSPEMSAKKIDDPTAGGAIKPTHKLYYTNSMVQNKYVDGKVYKELIKNYVTEPEFQIQLPEMTYVDMKCSGMVPAKIYNLQPLNKYLPSGFELTTITIPSTFKTPEPNSNNLLLFGLVFILFIRNLRTKHI